MRTYHVRAAPTKYFARLQNARITRINLPGYGSSESNFIELYTSNIIVMTSSRFQFIRQNFLQDAYAHLVYFSTFVHFLWQEVA